MKKPGFSALVALTIAFFSFTLGYFLGANRSPQPVILSVPTECQTMPSQTLPAETAALLPEETIAFPIDINTAGTEEFIALPGIGEVLAQRILDYREAHGKFTSLEELMNVSGIGTKRFETILDYITLGG